MSVLENNRKVLVNHYQGLLEEITREEDSTGIKDTGIKDTGISGTDLAPDDIQIITAATGDPALCVKGVSIHSGRDPAREGLRLAQSVSGGGPVIILGFGLGYSATALADVAAEKLAASQARDADSRAEADSRAAAEKRPIIIVEKHRKLLVKAFETRDLSSFLSKNRIIFVVGGSGEGITNALNAADGFISASEKSEPVIIRNRALIDLDKEWYGVVEEKIRTWSMKDDVNSATLKRFGKRWVRNLSRNISAIRDYAGISRLEGLAAGVVPGAASAAASAASAAAGAASAAGVPVFLAAAGPSLDKVRPYLQEIRKRCVIVAVDTSFRFFTDNGIQPDFLLVVDPQYWNSRHLDRCPCGHTALIAESAVYPPVLRLPFKNIFLCGSLFPLGSFVEKQVDPKGTLGAGGSVSTTAWDFARTLGSNEIWIAGLDLAFPDFKTHFRGAAFETRANSLSNRFNPIETWVVRALRDGSPFYAPCAKGIVGGAGGGIAPGAVGNTASAVGNTASAANNAAPGGQVLTDRRLSLYAAWFENSFRRRPEVKNYGLFQEGLAIAGIQPAAAETLLSLPERRAEIDKKITEAFSKIENDFNGSEEKQKRAERYAKAVSSLIRGLEDVRNAAKKGAEITKQALMGKQDPGKQNKILKELDEIMRRITESEVKEVAGFLFPAENKNNETESAAKDSFRAYLESSNKFLSSLAQTVEFNLENLK